MLGKNILGLCFVAGIIGLSACSSSYFSDEVFSSNDGTYYVDENSVEIEGLSQERSSFTVYNKRKNPLNSLVVCRAKQCAPADLSMSKEYIFNSLAHLVDNNLDTKALLCEANPQAHVCINPYLTVPAKIGLTPAYVFIDGVKIIDASLAKGKTAINLVLGYNINYNGQTPSICKPDRALAYVKDNNDVVLNGNGFQCDMTSIGTTIVKVMFDIDFIDLDYGYIGGYYSVGLSGPATGGGTGYGIIRLVKDAHPLNPKLMIQKEQKKTQSLPVYKTEVKEAEVKVNPKMSALPEEVKVESVSKKEDVDVDQSSEYKDSGEKKVKIQSKETSISPKSGEYRSEFSRGLRKPVKITPDTIVKSDRVILKPESRDLRPVDLTIGQDEVVSEEIEVDDLDDYIK